MCQQYKRIFSPAMKDRTRSWGEMSIQGLCWPSTLPAWFDDEAFLLQVCFDPRQQTLGDCLSHLSTAHLYARHTSQKSGFGDSVCTYFNRACRNAQKSVKCAKNLDFLNYMDFIVLIWTMIRVLILQQRLPFSDSFVV